MHSWGGVHDDSSMWMSDSLVVTRVLFATARALNLNIAPFSPSAAIFANCDNLSAYTFAGVTKPTNAFFAAGELSGDTAWDSTVFCKFTAWGSINLCSSF